MEWDEDGSDVYDEIDRHHMGLDLPDEDDARSARRKREEILNVEGNSDDDDEDGSRENDSEGSNGFSDSDSDVAVYGDNVDKCKLVMHFSISGHVQQRSAPLMAHNSAFELSGIVI